MKKVVLYSTKYCGFCMQAKRFFQDHGVDFEEVFLDDKPDLRLRLSQENKGWRTVPMIFVGERFIGGYSDMMVLHREGSFLKLLASSGSFLGDF